SAPPLTSTLSLHDALPIYTETGASVNGRSATKYRFEVDFRKVLQTYGAGLDNAEELAQLELDAIPLDVYLDDRDLPARVRIDFSTMFEQMIEQVGGGDTVPDGVNFDEAYMQMDFTNWGNEVHIEPPPADEISDEPFPGLD